MKSRINIIRRVFLMLLCLTPLLWFFGKGQALIDGLDTNFPLNPLVWFLRRLYVWNGAVNAGSDFSSSIAGTFFHLVQVIPYVMHFSLQLTDIISIVFWFSSIILSSYFFIKVLLPKNFMVQMTFVILYSFNIYLFNT